MDFNAPKLRKITEIPEAATLQLNSDFWEISVPPEDDVVWCIVLSYLISEDFKPPQDLHNRLKILTDRDAEENAIEQAIKSFNPFQDRYSCFENDAMKKVIEDFKTSLNWDKLAVILDKFSDVSFLLNRRIYVITDGISYDTSVECSLNEVETIVLFSSLENGRRVFSFGINADFCRKKRKASLLNYFKQLKSFRRIIPLSYLRDLVTDEEDLLITLLKSDYSYIVPDILNCPRLLSKAIEVGYSVDIRSVDSDGFSSLYHAIMSCDTRICYGVYYFAVKDFQSTKSYRSPTSQNIRNLQNIAEILSNDQTKSNNFENSENPETSEILFHSLFFLNKFLMKITRMLWHFNTEKLELKNSSNEELLLATIERKKMLLILNTYLDYFSSIELSHNNVNLHKDLNGFIKCKSYCHAIDILTCFLFFDHIHDLKKQFAVPNVYPKIESDFFILALTYAIFGKEQESGNFQILHSFSGKNINILYEIPFQIRNSTVASIELFCESLKNFQTTPQNKTVNEFSSILQSNKKIRNYLKCCRLETYFKAAETIQSWSRKSVLAIERVLQVIGENIIDKPVHQKRFEWFLYLYLPQDIGQILFDLRNTLSHYEFSSFSNRVQSENNFLNFRGIQREIRVLHDYLQPFFNIITLHINAYANKKLKFYINRLNLPNVYRKKLIIHRLIHCIPETTFKKCYSDIHHVFSVILKRVGIELEKEQCIPVKKLIYPLVRIIKSVQELQHKSDEKLLQKSKFSRLFPFLKKLKEKTFEIQPFLYRCRNFVAIKPPVIRNIAVTDKEELLAFQMILTSTVLTDPERDFIRNQIPIFVRNFVAAKDDLKKYIADYSRPVCQTTREMFSDKVNQYYIKLCVFPLIEYYQIKNQEDISNSIRQMFRTGEHIEDFSRNYKFSDPIKALEEVFSRNHMELTEYKRICSVMQFSNKTKKLLRKLCTPECDDDEESEIEQNIYESDCENNEGGRFKLSFLLDRIQLMENILITDNSEISRSCIYDKGKKYEREFFEKATDYFISNSEVKASIEMLFLDCMELFGKTDDQIWLKTSGMYDDIYLRNVMAHGDFLLENLCELLDPLDLPIEILKKVVGLIQDKDCIEAILKLYETFEKNIMKLENVISYQLNDQQKLLLEPINKCKNKQRYIQMLKEK